MGGRRFHEVLTERKPTDIELVRKPGNAVNRNDSAHPHSSAGAKPRDPALDIFRGIAISEVLLHHVSAFAMRKTTLGSWSHDFFALLNRTLHFAVPAFLFIMALLLTRTMLGRSRSWKEFYERRARQTLLPYLIWTGIYGLFRALVLPEQHWGDLLDPGRWRLWLLWGKSWYHLYFLVLALQLYIVFPLVLILLRRTGVRLGPLLCFGVVAQIAAHWVHAQWIRSHYPATLLLWYIVPVLAGVWVGLHLEEWDRLWRRIRTVALSLMLLGWALYLPQGYRQLHGLPVNSALYHFSYWSYTTAMAFCLLALARSIARNEGWLARGFWRLGVFSMPIYLVHPMLLHFWSVAPHTGSTLRFHFTTLLVTLTVLGGSLLVAWVAARTPGGQILFGRGDARARA
jgi:surface polysaccharide O-acyltransferase-like enzyme